MTLEELIIKLNETKPSWFDELPEQYKETIRETGMESYEWRHTGTKFKLESLMQDCGLELEDLFNTPVKIILAMFDMNATLGDHQTTMDEIEHWKNDCPV